MALRPDSGLTAKLEYFMSDRPHILIVEDDLYFRRFIVNLLNYEGYQHHAVDCGRKAIEYLTHHTVDLVLLDLVLPDMDGSQILDHIKPETSAPRFIIMTGNASLDSAVDLLHKGAYDYLQKPFATKKLLKKIENALENKKLEKALMDSEQEFRDLVENSLIGISIIQNNHYVYKNPIQEKLFGPVTDKSLKDLTKSVHPDDIDKVQAAYNSLLAGTVQTVEFECKCYPSGDMANKMDMIWIQCRGSAIKYRGEDAILLNIIDTTQAKQLEQQLIIKNKMLSLGRVAAGIAHEIRNPLTGINSYLYTLDDLCHGETISHDDIQLMQQIVEQVQVASNKIESVIKRVMDFSKPGAPRMVLSAARTAGRAGRRVGPQ
jgi:PAS domain S-box-containing protein